MARGALVMLFHADLYAGYALYSSLDDRHLSSNPSSGTLVMIPSLFVVGLFLGFHLSIFPPQFSNEKIYYDLNTE